MYLQTIRIPSAAKQAAEEIDPEGDGGFNPRITPAESTRALAPEGFSPSDSPRIPLFFLACSAAFCFAVQLRASERFFTSRLARRSIVFSF